MKVVLNLYVIVLIIIAAVPISSVAKSAQKRILFVKYPSIKLIIHEGDRFHARMSN